MKNFPFLSIGQAIGSMYEPRKIGTEQDMDVWETPSGDTFTRQKGQGPGIPWFQLDPETQLNDLRSLTIWNQVGTSEGDRWPLSAIMMARAIVGNSPDVTPEHIQQFLQWMMQTGNMAYMAPHPGKKAYTKEYFKK